MDDVRRPRGQLENEVLAALATGPGLSSPAEVAAQIDGNLAYTTVMTTLSRLHDKGAVSREAAGRGYVYRLAADRSALTARQMRKLLDRGEDRRTVLARFLDELPESDRPLLQRLLDETERP